MQQDQREQRSALLPFYESTSQFQRLDPAIRSEVTSLLKLLLNECVARAARAAEENDE
jgi:hypothetical protein